MISKKNFFLSPYYTEFFLTEAEECWIYGDQVDNIDENTPRLCLGAYDEEVSGLTIETTLPITDGHGGVEFVTGFPFEGLSVDLGCFRADKISQWYNCNLIKEHDITEI
jgi:hypothetical protein